MCTKQTAWKGIAMPRLLPAPLELHVRHEYSSIAPHLVEAPTKPASVGGV